MFRTGSCSLPHPEKIDTGGEDAYFVSSDSCALGVADGVGGWRESGVDPGDYSRTLMRSACDYFDAGQSKRPADNREWEETVRGAIAVAHQKTRMPGSSTACVLALNARDKYISAANLGDSGFIVVRNGTVLFQTPTLQHFFDCPYQLGAYPDFVDATDYPSDAETYTLNVMPGDTIVIGSDGLWDNCPLDEIVQLLPDTDEAVENAAEVIAAAAREHAGAVPYFAAITMLTHHSSCCIMCMSRRSVGSEGNAIACVRLNWPGLVLSKLQKVMCSPWPRATSLT